MSEMPCPERTKTGDPCRYKAQEKPDPDGKRRCGRHSLDPERVARREARSRKGAAALHGDKPTGEIIEGDFGRDFDLRTLGGIQSAIEQVAGELVRGAVSPQAGGAFVKLGELARGLLKDERETGDDDEKTGGEIREFRFQVARRADGSDG